MGGKLYRSDRRETAPSGGGVMAGRRGRRGRIKRREERQREVGKSPPPPPPRGAHQRSGGTAGGGGTDSHARLSPPKAVGRPRVEAGTMGLLCVIPRSCVRPPRERPLVLPALRVSSVSPRPVPSAPPPPHPRRPLALRSSSSSLLPPLPSFRFAVPVLRQSCPSFLPSSVLPFRPPSSPG